LIVKTWHLWHSTACPGSNRSFSIWFQFPEKATPVALMTDARPDGFDTHEERIGVAIHAHFADPQHMAARLALLPKLVARAAEEHHLTSALCLGEGLRIHEAEHQHVASVLVLDDGRYQSAAFLKLNLHGVFS